jgi:hypothetical protein
MGRVDPAELTVTVSRARAGGSLASRRARTMLARRRPRLRL